jgi:hypothetical protein
MARTGIGIGLGTTVGILGTLAAGFMVLSGVFYGQAQNARREAAEAKSGTAAFIAENERNGEAARTLLAEASKGTSLFAFMQQQQTQISEKVLGTQGKSLKDVVAAVDAALKDSGQTSLMGLLESKASSLAQTQRSAADADAARQAALQDLQGQAALTKKQKEDFDAATASMAADVNKYKGEIDRFAAEVNKAKADMAAAIERTKREAEDREAELNNRLAKTNEELAVARGIIARFQKDRSKDQLRPTDEFALVDGEIIALDVGGAGTATINRGKKDKVILGQTFEVYSSPAALRPNPETGEYPRGKATLEVISIEKDAALTRVIRTQRGNPIVRGDVIANAIWDPNKTYTFVVLGNFDFNADGAPTSAEQSDIRALIENWGGRVTDTLAGDVDFLVLGSRPVVPPAPPSDAPAAVLEAYIRQRRIQQDYDRLIEQAAATSIPILNQNRLFTLTGYSDRR